MSIEQCQLIELIKINDPRGNLTSIENQRRIPFEIRRVYYLYDVPSGAARAGHAHKKLEQLIIPVAGSFDVHLDDGNKKNTVTLNRPNVGLYLCSSIWRELSNFSSGAVCLVLASEYYDEADYYRDYSEFLKAVKYNYENSVYKS